MEALCGPNRTGLSKGILFMKVLHFYKTFSPQAFGGTEMSIRQLCYASKHLDVSNSILSLSPHPTDVIETDAYTAYQAKEHINIASNAISFSVFKKFKELATASDIIHYHFPWPFMDIVHLLSGIKKPTLVTYESDIVRQKLFMPLYRPLMHRFLEDVDHIVATSPNYLKTSKVLQCYQHKTSVIPIGLDKNTYPTPTRAALEKWQQTFQKPFFLFVGVMRHYKGLHILLDAAKNTDLPIVILGSGPVEMVLKEQAKQLQLKHVFFLGVLPEEDKVALLSLCYAIVFPSHLRSEAFGISLLEGAMFGKPLISSEIGTGTSYINIHKETGYVVPPSNPEALRKAMQDLYDNKLLAEQMGKNAEIRYQTLFTADKMASAYYALYQKLINIL
ncbi:MAG: wbcW [Gammaproteobacteria bacterium]|jgi:rhamnosyl/mannosyltransferase|nr:wbcW [Gammaproteobacteria bacterium]